MNDLLKNLIENVIANIPNLVVIVSTILFNLKNLNKDVLQTKDTSINIKKNIEETLLIFEAKILDIVSNSMDSFVEKADNKFNMIEEKINKYSGIIESYKEILERVMNENKAFKEIIIYLTGKDPKNIKEGTNKYLEDKFNMDKQLLIRTPEEIKEKLPQIIFDIETLAGAIGEKEFLRIVGEINEKQKLQVKK